MTAYSIRDFKTKFFSIFSFPDYSKSISQNDAKGKWQTKYLYRYLDKLNCQSILIETEYVDHDFLDDFANYYAKCFDPYRRFCRRAHFWNFDIGNIDIKELILKNGEEKQKLLQDKYLGFIVIKPLPNTVIGRTVLRTWTPDNGKRKYKAIRKYNINLFGINLELDSLAFQEQDSVVAACATTALWSAFQKTSSLFGTVINTPSEITKSATRYILTARSFPSGGLTIEQICSAVSKNGLVPEVRQINENTTVNSLLYAYASAELPVILCYYMAETDAYHAVTVCGYRMETESHSNRESADDKELIVLKGRKISAFFVHDDNLGPFAQLESCVLDDRIKTLISKNDAEMPVNPRVFRRSLKGYDKTIRHCIPKVMVIPMYHKIRLKYGDVLGTIRSINKYFLAINKHPLDKRIDNWFEWDIRLMRLREFKQKVVELATVSDEDKTRLLLASLPRYIWVATAWFNNERMFSFIADATDIKQSFYFRYFVPHDDLIKRQMAKVIQTSDPEQSRAAQMGLGAEFASFIRQEILT